MDTMQLLVSKLPWVQVEKWSKYFDEPSEEAKARPFDFYLRWLEKAGGSWEVIVDSGVGRKGKGSVEH